MYINGACYSSHAHTMIQCHHDSHTYPLRCVVIIAHQYRLHQGYVIVCTCITPSNLPIASGALSLNPSTSHLTVHPFTLAYSTSLRHLPFHSGTSHFTLAPPTSLRPLPLHSGPSHFTPAPPTSLWPLPLHSGPSPFTPPPSHPTSAF